MKVSSPTQCSSNIPIVAARLYNPLQHRQLKVWFFLKTTILHYGVPVCWIVATVMTDLRKNEGRICGNKMPTRCNRGFYCRSYCLLKMFRASLCPSSGAQEYYIVVAACGILCCGFSSSWSGVELRVMCLVCRMLRILQTRHITLS